MQITISQTIFSGNIGGGWRDEQKVAEAFAASLRTQLITAAQGRYPEATIVVAVHVAHDTRDRARGPGYTPDLEVSVAGEGSADVAEMERSMDVRMDLEAHLQPLANAAWDAWVVSPEAAAYDTEHDDNPDIMTRRVPLSVIGEKLFPAGGFMEALVGFSRDHPEWAMRGDLRGDLTHDGAIIDLTLPAVDAFIEYCLTHSLLHDRDRAHAWLKTMRYLRS